MNIHHLLNPERVQPDKKRRCPIHQEGRRVEGETAVLLLPDMCIAPLDVCWRLSL